MTIKDLLEVLTKFDNLKNQGGKTYKQITNLLNQEANTHNIQQIKLFIDDLKDT